MAYYKNLSFKNIEEVIDGILYKEKWREIIGYKSRYKISSFGRIKSISRIVTTSGIIKSKVIKPKMMKQSLDKDGYCKVTLSKDGKQTSYSVHRLLAIAFFGDKKHLHVNHKKGVKNFNHVSKLEWCTPSYNRKHAFLTGLQKARIGKESGSSKCVIQKSVEGFIIKEWDSTMDIQRDLGYPNSNISRCCLGGRPTAYGYKWEYKTA